MVWWAGVRKAREPAVSNGSTIFILDYSNLFPYFYFTLLSPDDIYGLVTVNFTDLS